MRRIVNSTYISLDGVIEDPQDWPFSRSDDGTGGKIQTELLLASDILLMGRPTYEGFAAVWPGRTGDPYSDHINAMDKYVVSSTLPAPAWHNTRQISGDPVAEITRLKEQPGKDIVQYGFGRLARTLIEHRLLDELRLWVHPLFVGGGDAGDLLFRQSLPIELELRDSTALTSGIVVLTYSFR
jgi:dihydrofolate reductase